MAKPTSRKKERGIFLTIILVLSIAAMVIGMRDSSTIIAIHPGQDQAITAGHWMGFVLTNVAIFASLYGIWQWKRWGVYLLLILCTISTLTTRFDTESIIFTFLADGLWLWAIYRKWRYFA